MSVLGRIARPLLPRGLFGACAAALGLLAGANVGRPADAATAERAAPVPLPALLVFAHQHDSVAGSFAVPVAQEGVRPGDTVAFLVSLREPRGERQWLVEMQIADLTEAERAAPPPPDEILRRGGDGPEIRFSNQHRLAVAISTVGPFTAGGSDPRPTAQRARTLLSVDFLGLGLDRACRLIMDLTARYGLNTKTPPPLSPEESRTAAGVLPTLGAFMQAAQATPGLREILWDITEKPSLWSILRRGGKVDTNLNIDSVPDLMDPKPWREATTADVFRMPLTVQLNGRPALSSFLIVTAPRPPLLTSAGIIAIEAEPPGHPERHLSIRLLGSQRAAAAPETPRPNT